MTYLEGVTAPVRVRTRRRDRNRQRLGELLVEQGLVTSADVDLALERQKESGERLGAILSGLGLVSTGDLGRTLAAEFGVEFVDLEERGSPPPQVGGLTEQFCRRHRVLPLDVVDDVLVVAMADPRDIFVIDDVRGVTGLDVRPVLADWGQLERVLDTWWNPKTGQDILKLADEESSEPESEGSPLPATAESDEGPVINFVNQLLVRAVQERVSDIHVEATPNDVRVRFRIDGALTDVMTLPKVLQPKVVSRLKIMGNVNIAEKRIAQDGRFSMVVSGRPVSVRIVTLPTPHGEAVILRVLEESNGLLDLDQLGMSPSARKAYEGSFRRPWGAILVTGPTGSGKSTTLYATLAEINDPDRNIVTVEDPIEYHLAGIKQVQLNNKAGFGFAPALRAILRSDPDVVLVGEIRDVETARIATEAALTGHLMLSTLHTNNAASAPMRLVDMGVEPFLVTSTVTCVVAQRLARRLCEKCKEPYVPTELELEDVFGSDWSLFDSDPKLYKPVGCGKCAETGYYGRVAIHEVLPVSEEICQLVLSRSTSHEIERLAVEQGMATMRTDGLSKAVAGLTSVREVLRAIG